MVRHLPGQTNPLDVVVATRHPPGAESLQPDVSLVTTRATPAGHPLVVVEDVVRDDHPLRHDPDKLATALMRIYEEQRRTRSTNGAVRAAR